jgi:hypothetical protein
MVTFTNRIVSASRKVILKARDVVRRHPTASAVVFNAAAISGVYLLKSEEVGLSLVKIGLPFIMLSCPTMRNNLEEMKREMNLPEKINTDMTTDLVDNITTPFELKMREKIREMAFDDADKRINNSEITGESIEHLADKHVLFEMLGEINSSPNKPFDPNSFGVEYLRRLAKEMKSEFFQNEAITAPELLEVIRDIEIAPGKNIADSVVNWIGKNKLFERENPLAKDTTAPTRTEESAADEEDGFFFGPQNGTNKHGGET